MRVTEPYTIFARKLPSGKTVYYYQVRNESGLRCVPKSTGCSTLPQARRFCQKLYNDGLFDTDSARLFKTFASDFFDKHKEFYKWKVANLQPITDSTLQSYVRLLNNQLMPFFADMPLCRITTAKVKDWIIWCTSNWSAKTTNNAQSVLNIILKSAYEKGLISKVPSLHIAFRKTTKKNRELLSVEEISRIYHSPLWYEEKDRQAFLLIAITGMREGECVGLQPCDIADSYLEVKHSYHPKFELGSTKTKVCRFIPIPNSADLKRVSGKKWVFERNSKPIPAHTLYMTFRKILDSLGIDRVGRGLTIHSLRNFYNSYLRSKNVPDSKIKAVIGHKDEDMTDWYTYWKPEMFPEVYQVQKELYEKIVR